MNHWEKILNEVLNLRAQENDLLPTPSNKTLNSARTKQAELSTKPKFAESHFLGKNFPGIYLTQREAECMLDFLQDKTVTEAAERLNLSPRTVEFYLKNMKTKLKCKSKSELIHKVRESDFSKNYLKRTHDKAESPTH